MEKKEDNRVMEGLLDWTDKENRMRGIFGNDVIKGKQFLESKMDFFDNLYRSCKPEANSEEKMLLNVIKGERRKLEKLIYPNTAVRLIVKVTRKIKEGIKSYRQDRSVKEEMLSLKVKKEYGGYDKKVNGRENENRNEVRESAREILDRYKKKDTSLKSNEGANKIIQKKEDTPLSKKKMNPNYGHGIY